MRRLGLAALVWILAFSASGVASLMTTEPCAASESVQDEHGGCSPMCVMCGCCAQAVEPTSIVDLGLPSVLVHVAPQPVLLFVTVDPRDILHVPKTSSL
jgi:hypothetical protein